MATTDTATTTRRRRGGKAAPAPESFDDRADVSTPTMEAETPQEAQQQPRRRRRGLPPETHVGPSTRDASDTMALVAEGNPLEVAREVEPRHAPGCPSDPENIETDGEAEGLDADQIADAINARRVERYPTTAPDGTTVAIVRCIDCGAHVRIDPD